MGSAFPRTPRQGHPDALQSRFAHLPTEFVQPAFPQAQNSMFSPESRRATSLVGASSRLEADYRLQ